MKYEFIIRVQEFSMSPRKDVWRGFCKEEYFDLTRKKFEDKLLSMQKAKSYYGIWLLCNKVSDDGEFLETVWLD